MTTLLIDNYDSFTFNLVQLLSTLGEPTIVVKNDDRSAWDALDWDLIDRVSCLPGREAPTAATTSVSASRSSSNGRSLCSVSASVTRRSARYPAPPSSVPRNRCMGT